MFVWQISIMNSRNGENKRLYNVDMEFDLSYTIDTLLLFG